MPRKSSPQALAIVGSSTAGIDERDPSLSPGSELNNHIIRSNNERINNVSLNSSPLSPLSPTTPKSPRSPFKFSLKSTASHNYSNGHPSMQVSDAQQQQQPQQQQQQEERDDENQTDLPASPTSLSHADARYQTLSSSPAEGSSGGPRRQGKGGFFSNYKASKSSSKVNANKSQVLDESMLSPEHNQSEMTSKVAVSSAAEAKNNGCEVKKTMTRKPVGGTAKSSDVSLALSTDSTTSDPTSRSAMMGTTTQTATAATQGKKNKTKPFTILGRSRSLRDKDKSKERDTKRSETQSPRQQSPSERSQNGRATPIESAEPRQPQAVYPQHDQNETPHDNKPLKETMGGSSLRQNSKDRKPIPVRETNMASSRDQHSKNQASVSSGNNAGHTFLSNLNTFGTKAADKIHKSIFSKVGRSGSTNEKDAIIGDDNYILKVFHAPLLEQTRKTRISKRLEDSRDKTEFWMPAFPWRAIDYLNYKGCEVEGLYRVPGSGPQIKLWQRRFDEEGDIDLFEQGDLYDINIVGSMLKSWLRELPDEILPKSSQDRVARECARLNITSDDVEHVAVPQVLVDELSNLSPFNYYLLFAITCHLSLLLNHSEKNKMDFRNLCICFQPCMKIDALCFKFLVCDWRSCWQGCKTESAYVEQEYQLFNMDPPAGTTQGEPPVICEGRSSLAVESIDERNLSSSGSSKPSSVKLVAESTGSKGKNGTPLGNTHNILNHHVGQQLKNGQSASTSLNLASGNAMTPRGSPGSSDMRPLSPIKPLSPMGL